MSLASSDSVSLLQTMSILEERLSMAENKIKECLDNQQRVTLQIRPND